MNREQNNELLNTFDESANKSLDSITRLKTFIKQNGNLLINSNARVLQSQQHKLKEFEQIMLEVTDGFTNLNLQTYNVGNQIKATMERT